MVRRLPHSDLIAAGALLALSAGVFAVSTGFPGGRSGDPGPAFFPRLVAGSIALLAVVQAVQYVRSDRRTVHEIDAATTRRVAVVTAFPVMYVFVMPFVGFLLTTIGFLAAFMWYSGARSLPAIAGGSVGVTLVLHYVFVGFFRVPLPEGIVPIARLLPSLWVGVI